MIHNPHRFYQTFEDPIEIETPREYTNIRQNTLDMRIGYHEQLKGIMRQSIDGIFVQEIRDHETASFMMHVVKSARVIPKSTKRSIMPVAQFA